MAGDTTASAPANRMPPSPQSTAVVSQVAIPADRHRLEGDLILPPGAPGVVLFAHGSGSSRHSRRNQYVAHALREHGMGTLLFDLLTPEEERVDQVTGRMRFDIALLAQRLANAAEWVHRQQSDLDIGYFGASTGGGAALVAETNSPVPIKAVVSRGGRPDLAGTALPKVKAPTLLIVGGDDTPVVAMNEEAFARLQCPKKFEIIPGAGHLFEEPGALEQVAQAAAGWFKRHFGCESGEGGADRPRVRRVSSQRRQDANGLGGWNPGRKSGERLLDASLKVSRRRSLRQLSGRCFPAQS
jgi:dienelactone hydrolase